MHGNSLKHPPDLICNPYNVFDVAGQRDRTVEGKGSSGSKAFLRASAERIYSKIKRIQ